MGVGGPPARELEVGVPIRDRTLTGEGRCEDPSLGVDATTGSIGPRPDRGVDEVRSDIVKDVCVLKLIIGLGEGTDERAGPGLAC